MYYHWTDWMAVVLCQYTEHADHITTPAVYYFCTFLCCKNALVIGNWSFFHFTAYAYDVVLILMLHKTGCLPVVFLHDNLKIRALNINRDEFFIFWGSSIGIIQHNLLFFQCFRLYQHRNRMSRSSGAPLLNTKYRIHTKNLSCFKSGVDYSWFMDNDTVEE